MSSLELLLTSSRSSQQWSAGLWDFNSGSGNIINTYKNGGVVLHNALHQIGNDYILTADQTKPLLHMWLVNKQEEVKNTKLIVPEPAGALALSPDNCYIAVGIGRKLYVWQLSSGKLLGLQEKHLLPITCIQFSSNADFLITTCQSGKVVAYNFGTLICLHTNRLAQSGIGQVEPMYCRVDHTSAITGLCVVKGGNKPRFATVSNDNTCRIHELVTGQPLLQLVYDEPLTSVILSASCWQLFIGTNTGTIQLFDLFNPPQAMTVHVDTNATDKLCFIGHEKKVTCLDLNKTNELLVSGSDDAVVILWNVRSRQMIMKINHKAAVTNARFIVSHDNINSHDFKAHYIVKSLEGTMNLDSKTFTVSVMQEHDIVFSDDEDDVGPSEASGKVGNFEEEMGKLKGTNPQLYMKLLELNKKFNSGK